MLSGYLKLGALVLVLLLLAWSHRTAYMAGKDAVLTKLAEDRVTVLRQGREIDEEVLRADDTALCQLLGGCMSDSSD